MYEKDDMIAAKRGAEKLDAYSIRKLNCYVFSG